MKILTIGDIHGRTNWKSFGDINIIWNIPYIKTDFDCYIFIGDYVDSFTISNTDILNNLKEIIEFKKNYPENVILLLGNHDNQYYYSDSIEYRCSGYRLEAYWDLHDLFNNNKNLFQVAFQLDNYIWTHAGIHKGWYEYSATPQIFEIGEELFKTSVANQLNELFKYNKSSLYDVSPRRGGYSKTGGIFWADKLETWEKPLENYHQIIGHTQVKNIVCNELNKNTSVTYIDCVNLPYILEI